MTTVLHCISAYPDPIGPETSASSRLLALTAETFTHRVYSFKRAGWRGAPRAIAFGDAAGDDHRAMVYGAPPRGLAFARTMAGLADWIIADATDRGIAPDLVHAHKLTLDGMVGARVAAHFGVPMAVTLQANTDTRILDTRRDLRAPVGEIWRAAAVVFPFTPVAATQIADRLGPRAGTCVVLPCPPAADTILAPAPRAPDTPPRIVTAFHLKHWRNKNIRSLLQAVAGVPNLRLDIIGGGDPDAFLTLSEMADRLAPGRVRLLGNRPPAQVQQAMNAATAFALVSRRESYGMVYAEALLAGTPCLHSSGRGFDGLFPEGAFTLGADPGDVAEITAALRRLVAEEGAFKARLAQAQSEGRLEILRAAPIARTYRHAVKAALQA